MNPYGEGLPTDYEDYWTTYEATGDVPADFQANLPRRFLHRGHAARQRARARRLEQAADIELSDADQQMERASLSIEGLNSRSVAMLGLKGQMMSVMEQPSDQCHAHAIDSLHEAAERFGIDFPT